MMIMRVYLLCTTIYDDDDDDDVEYVSISGLHIAGDMYFFESIFTCSFIFIEGKKGNNNN